MPVFYLTQPTFSLTALVCVYLYGVGFRKNITSQFRPDRFSETCQVLTEHNLLQALKVRSPITFGSWGFQGIDPISTLVVALDGAGTRPTPTCSHTPRIPNEPDF